MRKTIFKNLHRPIQMPAFLTPCGIINRSRLYCISRKVKFHDNCAYDLGNNKQGDWNKLFGVCYGITGIHKSSVRFGWRYNTKKGKIELCAIIYNKGVPTRQYLNCDVKLNQELNLQLQWEIFDTITFCYFYIGDKKIYTARIDDNNSICYFGCGLYFGGTSRAPHKMTFEITKQ